MVLSLHFERARNRIFLNRGLKQGVPQFEDVTEKTGLPAEMPNKSPHVEVQDFDNDGWPDLYFSTAWLDAQGEVTLAVFRHAGLKDGVPQFVPPRPIQGPMVYYPAGPSGDYNRDGRVDLFLINWFQGNHSRLLKNVSSPNHHWLNVQVIGTKKMNRMGIGAQVRIYEAGKLGQPKSLLGFQEQTTGYGYASGQEAVCHFGLGMASSVDVEIRTPGGAVFRQTGVQADQQLKIQGP